MSNKKYRILVCTDAINAKGGYARIGSKILESLHAAGHDMAQLAWYHNSKPPIHKPWSTFTTFKDHTRCCNRGQPIVEVFKENKIRYVGLDKNHVPISADKDGSYCGHGRRIQNDQYGHSSINLATSIFRPEIVITIGDQWMCQSAHTCQLRDTFVHIMYAAVDGEPLPRFTQRAGHYLDWQELYTKTDYPVAYCNWALDTANTMVGKDVVKDVIPFGVNSDIFKILSSTVRKKLRLTDTHGFVSIGRTAGAVIWNIWNPKPNDFNILYVGRNIQRKNIPFMFETIAEFKKRGYETNRRIKFLLHMPYHDNGWNMDELIRQFDAYEWTLINPSVSPGIGPEDKELNEIYNLADVHFHMSAAEGYDLPTLESLSAGVITTSMNYSAPPSWGGEVLQLIDPIVIRQEPMTNLGRAYPDVNHAVEVLNRIYCLPHEEKIRLGTKGRIHAEKLSWNKFRDNWIDLINRVEVPSGK